jgi:hypothetical protein
MSILRRLNQIERLDSLIRRKSTGSVSDIAMKLEVSERNVYHLLDLMKDLGAPIYFCRSTNSYCYESEVRFSFGFVSANELQSVKGGYDCFFYEDCKIISVAHILFTANVLGMGIFEPSKAT